MEKELEDGKKLRKKKIRLIFLESFLLLLVLLLGATIYLLSFEKAYANKIYPNVKFDDINLSGVSQQEALKLVDNLNNKLIQQKITIVTESKQSDISINDAGAGLDIKKIVSEAYGIGRDKNFFLGIYKSAKTIFLKQSVVPSIKTDKTKFDSLIAGLTSELTQKAVDADIKINGAQVEITDSQKGLTVDQNDLTKKISDALNDRTKKTIKPKTVYSDPQIVETNLISAKTEAEDLMKKNLNFSGAEVTVFANQTTIGSWLSFNKTDPLKIVTFADDNKIAAYVANTLAKKIDIAKVDRKISAINQSVISEGISGRHLERSDSQKKIKDFMLGSALSAQIVLTVTTDVFGDQQVFPDEGVVPGRFPGKYIDIDLTHQQMYLFDGANQIAQYTVSSGKWSTPTPIGTRYILDKTPRAWSAPYGLYMPWWQSLGAGYGIHELPEWPGGKKEGENHLGTPVSHGCIRLGVGPAQTVYDWTDIGTPVYIHK